MHPSINDVMQFQTLPRVWRDSLWFYILPTISSSIHFLNNIYWNSYTNCSHGRIFFASFNRQSRDKKYQEQWIEDKKFRKFPSRNSFSVSNQNSYCRNFPEHALASSTSHAFFTSHFPLEFCSCISIQPNISEVFSLKIDTKHKPSLNCIRSSSPIVPRKMFAQFIFHNLFDKFIWMCMHMLWLGFGPNFRLGNGPIQISCIWKMFVFNFWIMHLSRTDYKSHIYRVIAGTIIHRNEIAAKCLTFRRL